MTPEKFKSTGESQSNLNIFKDARFLMVLAILAVLTAGCGSQNSQADEIDQDLAGLPDDSDGIDKPKEWMQPVAEKDTNPIIICEELPITDAGVEVDDIPLDGTKHTGETAENGTETNPITETQLYRDVVKALKLKNNR